MTDSDNAGELRPIEAQDEIQEYAALCDKLSALLDGVCDALKGPPPPLTRYSFHDLPEFALLVRNDAVKLAEALRALSIVRFYPGASRTEIDKAALAAGVALGAHDKLFEAIRK